MFDINPFAQLSSSVPPLVMQLFVIVMILMVAGGTLFDIIHKGSAKYFFQLVKKSKANGTLTVSTGEKLAVVVKTTAHDVLTSGEFCSTRRRIAHLLTMYGFVIYVVSTVIMVFGYSSLDTLTPAILPYLWWLGGAMICVGGYWFWFFIRVDVSAEGNSPFRLIRADLFVVSRQFVTGSELQHSGQDATSVPSRSESLKCLLCRPANLICSYSAILLLRL